MTLTNREKAEGLAERTHDAYSVDRYANWEDVAEVVLAFVGELVEETADDDTGERTECVLRSKHMRWAADDREDPDALATTTDVIDHLQRNKVGIWNMLEREGLA